MKKKYGVILFILNGQARNWSTEKKDDIQGGYYLLDKSKQKSTKIFWDFRNIRNIRSPHSFG